MASMLNCKGIIEKYRKMSQIFSVCLLVGRKREGEGSRFFFRLPKEAGWSAADAVDADGMWDTGPAESSLNISPQASAYADSAYFSNINGTYDETLDFADSCRHYLNDYLSPAVSAAPTRLLPLGRPSLMPPEISWYHDSLATNYDILLSMRNESAVAALALHQWQVYQYNNRIYTQLFKEMSADSTLDDYCRKMQQSQTNKQVAIILLVLLFLMILAVVTGRWWSRWEKRRNASRNSRTSWN